MSTDDRTPPGPSRREFLKVVGGLIATAAAGCAKLDPGGEGVPEAPELDGDPFTLGVASGDPDPTSFVIWTRLAPDPLSAGGEGGMPSVDVPVRWEISDDAEFRDVIHRGWTWATALLGHSVHVVVDRLVPDRWYWYRFRVGDAWTSPVGRSRTFPRPGDSPERMRLAAATCQQYRDGFYTAHANMAREELDAVFFLGDYIYESKSRPGDVRQQPMPTEARSLGTYRNRHALYKSDEDLQACHAAFPWILTWDDHEVRNNYASTWSPNEREDEAQMARRRAEAYQAYYEHMPLRIPNPGSAPEEMEIHRRLDFGDLASIHVLDGRQFRSEPACQEAEGSLAPACDEVFDPERTMLGDEQREWLVAGLRESAPIWRIIAQQTVFSPINVNYSIVNFDQWDGYAVERQALLDVFAEDGVENVAILTGDIHIGGFASLHADADRTRSRTVGYEIITTSITSTPPDEFIEIGETAERFLDNVHYLNVAERGYAIVELRRDKMTVEYRVVSTITEPTADVRTDAMFEITPGSLEFVQIRGGKID